MDNVINKDIKDSLSRKYDKTDMKDVTDQQVRRRNNTTYFVSKEYLTDTSKFQKKQKLKSINDVVANLPGLEEYSERFKEGIDAAPDQKEEVELVSSLGSRYALSGEDVLEFSIGGSSFANPTQRHKGISGHGKLLFHDEEGNVVKKKVGNKKVSYNWVNKYFRWLNFLPRVKIKSKREAEDYNHLVELHNQKRDEVYGEKMEYKGKLHNGMRIKSATNSLGVNKTRISLSGPLSAGGMLNRGTYKKLIILKNILRILASAISIQGLMRYMR